MTHIDLSPPARALRVPGANLRWLMLGVIFLTRTSMGFQFQSIAALTPFLVPAFDLTYAEVGLMKIGDFACFCHFLESMSS